MIAQCTSCGHTFETETWGVQTCPNCGTRVMIDAPPPEAPEPAPGPEAEVEVPPPFEDPSLGFFAGYLETWKQTLFHPTEIFSRMPVNGPGRAFLYAWVTQVVAGEIGLLWSYLQLHVQQSMMANLQGGLPPETAQLFKTMSVVYGGLGFILMPVAAVIGIFLFAGLTHLAALIAGAAGRGWDATFRATCYSTGPQLFAVIPVCGSLVGSIWALVLAIVALMHTQRVSGGRATVAVLLFPVLLLCCCGALFLVGVATGGAALQQAMQGH